MSIKITQPLIYNKANEIIKKMYGPSAQFRDGQYEAIEATMTKKRVLVVQRTGWGKSLVYFVCTKLMRKEHKGVTMVVSPLLVLMQNQIEAAEKMGLRCDVLNSTTKERQSEILDSLERDELDLVLVTPETLFSNDVKKRLKNIRIGLFVIDEAHCISDWGHDFRLEYGDLKAVISSLPSAVPILATTATANNRVVEDLEKQLGANVYVSRGSLARDSLYIQVLPLSDKIKRYAWILENINKLPGSGIIYCLTQRDCDYLSDFLRKHGVSAESYHADIDNEINKDIEERFRNNKIKVLVATIKLGMGYDKGDIAFIIHYQMPKDIVSYYQQIGRAGRSIDRAYTFLMFGKEDEDILNHFINTAFPTKRETTAIMEFVSKRDGVRKGEIQSEINIRGDRMEKALTFLQHDGFIMKDRGSGRYYSTPRLFIYNSEHYDAITAVRRREMEQMKALATTTGCYSKFVVTCLDDPGADNCGHCANCLEQSMWPKDANEESIHKAEAYINGLSIEIVPRKRFVHSQYTDGRRISIPNRTGVCLSKYGDAGYGALVKRDKYSLDKRFCDELLAKSAELLSEVVRDNDIKYITCVPSLRSNIVLDFAKRLAKVLGIRFVELLKKSDTKQQKEMQNSSHQCANAMHSFGLLDGVRVPKKVLLIDDVVDSRWTLTACGYYLTEGGCEEVYPFALADSSQREDG